MHGLPLSRADLSSRLSLTTTNRGSLEEENDQRRARRIIPGVQDTIKDLSVIIVGVVVGLTICHYVI